MKMYQLKLACTIGLVVLVLTCYTFVNRCDYWNERSGKKKIDSLMVSSDCHPGIPCRYSDVQDLRLIVITYNRKDSLLKLLKSLQDLDMDGNTVSLEIWIDRSKEGKLHGGTLEAAISFPWRLGQKRVHVQKKHVGIYGQWIDTWRPPTHSNELALILEDDLSVSPHAWKWIKAVHQHFGNRSDCMGYSLQSHGVNIASGKRRAIEAPVDDSVFMYRVPGSWGFIPNPKVWNKFQHWFHDIRNNNTKFKPYVGSGVVFDSWYKSFEKKGTADSMWTIWFIYFTNVHNMFCVYSNLNRHLKGNNNCIGVHRQEPGLHFHGKGVDNSNRLLQTWDVSYVNFPEHTALYDFDGNMRRK